MTKIYRDKSLENIKSPDSLNEYIRVIRPGTWLVLGAIVLFLIGLLIWGIFGRITVKLDGLSLVDQGKIYVLIDKDNIERVQPGMEIRVGEMKGEVETVYSEIRQLGEVCDEYKIYTGKYDRNQDVGLVEGSMRVPDGSYECNVVLKSLSPVSLLTN